MDGPRFLRGSGPRRRLLACDAPPPAPGLPSERGAKGGGGFRSTLWVLYTVALSPVSWDLVGNTCVINIRGRGNRAFCSQNFDGAVAKNEMLTRFSPPARRFRSARRAPLRHVQTTPRSLQLPRRHVDGGAANQGPDPGGQVRAVPLQLFLLSLRGVGRLGQSLSSDYQLDAVCALIIHVCCALFLLSLARLLGGAPVSLSLCLSVSPSLSFPFLVAPLSRSPGMQTMTPH